MCVLTSLQDRRLTAYNPLDNYLNLLRRHLTRNPNVQAFFSQRNEKETIKAKESLTSPQLSALKAVLVDDFSKSSDLRLARMCLEVATKLDKVNGGEGVLSKVTRGVSIAQASQEVKFQTILRVCNAKLHWVRYGSNGKSENEKIAMSFKVASSGGRKRKACTVIDMSKVHSDSDDDDDDDDGRKARDAFRGTTHRRRFASDCNSNSTRSGFESVASSSTAEFLGGKSSLSNTIKRSRQLGASPQIQQLVADTNRDYSSQKTTFRQEENELLKKIEAILAQGAAVAAATNTNNDDEDEEDSSKPLEWTAKMARATHTKQIINEANGKKRERKDNTCRMSNQLCARLGTGGSSYYAVGLNYVSMLTTRSVLILYKKMVFMQMNVLIVNLVNEFVRKMIEFGFINRDNANTSYFSMVRTTVNSNMQFPRRELDRSGTLRNVFEHNSRLDEQVSLSVMMYEMLVATACGQKSISPAAVEMAGGNQKLSEELKDVAACFRGERITRRAIRNLYKLAGFEGNSDMNFTNYVSLATYFSNIYSAINSDSKLAFPSHNVHSTSYYNFSEMASLITPHGFEFEPVVSKIDPSNKDKPVDSKRKREGFEKLVKSFGLDNVKYLSPSLHAHNTKTNKGLVKDMVQQIAQKTNLQVNAETDGSSKSMFRTKEPPLFYMGKKKPRTPATTRRRRRRSDSDSRSSSNSSSEDEEENEHQQHGEAKKCAMTTKQAVDSIFKRVSSDEFVLKCSLRKMKLKAFKNSDMLSNHVEKMLSGLESFDPVNNLPPKIIIYTNAVSNHYHLKTMVMHYFNSEVRGGSSASKQSTMFKALVNGLEKSPLENNFNKEGNAAGLALAIGHNMSVAARQYDLQSRYLDHSNPQADKLSISVAKNVHNVIGGVLTDKMVDHGRKKWFLNISLREEQQRQQRENGNGSGDSSSSSSSSSSSYELLGRFMNGESLRDFFLHFTGMRNAVRLQRFRDARKVKSRFKNKLGYLEDSYRVFEDSDTFNLVVSNQKLFGPILEAMENHRFGALYDCVLTPSTYMSLVLNNHRLDASKAVISDQDSAYLFINSPHHRLTRGDALKSGSVLQMFSANTSDFAFDMAPRMFCFNGDYVANNQCEEMTIETDTSIKNNIKPIRVLANLTTMSKDLITDMLHVLLNPSNEVMVMCMYEFYKKCSENQDGDGKGGNGSTKPENVSYMKSAKNSIKQEFAHCFTQGFASSGLAEERKKVLHMNDENAVFVLMLENCKKTDAQLSRTTRSALHRIYNQVTSSSGAHLLYTFRKFALFMGYLYVYMSADIEGAHHILFCLLCVAFNTAIKMIILLVGLLGNNGKTVMMNLMQKMLYGSTMASVQLQTLQEGHDSNAHSGNLIPILGRQSVLVADECGVEKPKTSLKQLQQEDKRRKEEERNAPTFLISTMANNNVLFNTESVMTNSEKYKLMIRDLIVKLLKNKKSATNSPRRHLQPEQYINPKIFCGQAVLVNTLTPKLVAANSSSFVVTAVDKLNNEVEFSNPNHYTGSTSSSSSSLPSSAFPTLIMGDIQSDNASCAFMASSMRQVPPLGMFSSNIADQMYNETYINTSTLQRETPNPYRLQSKYVQQLARRETVARDSQQDGDIASTSSEQPVSFRGLLSRTSVQHHSYYSNGLTKTLQLLHAYFVVQQNHMLTLAQTCRIKQRRQVLDNQEESTISDGDDEESEREGDSSKRHQKERRHSVVEDDNDSELEEDVEDDATIIPNNTIDDDDDEIKPPQFTSKELNILQLDKILAEREFEILANRLNVTNTKGGGASQVIRQQKTEYFSKLLKCWNPTIMLPNLRARMGEVAYSLCPAWLSGQVFEEAQKIESLNYCRPFHLKKVISDMGVMCNVLTLLIETRKRQLRELATTLAFSLVDENKVLTLLEATSGFYDCQGTPSKDLGKFFVPIGNRTRMQKIEDINLHLIFLEDYLNSPPYTPPPPPPPQQSAGEETELEKLLNWFIELKVTVAVTIDIISSTLRCGGHYDQPDHLAKNMVIVENGTITDFFSTTGCSKHQQQPRLKVHQRRKRVEQLPYQESQELEEANDDDFANDDDNEMGENVREVVMEMLAKKKAAGERQKRKRRDSMSDDDSVDEEEEAAATRFKTQQQYSPTRRLLKVRKNHNERIVVCTGVLDGHLGKELGPADVSLKEVLHLDATRNQPYTVNETAVKAVTEMILSPYTKKIDSNLVNNSVSSNDANGKGTASNFVGSAGNVSSLTNSRLCVSTDFKLLNYGDREKLTLLGIYANGYRSETIAKSLVEDEELLSLENIQNQQQQQQTPNVDSIDPFDSETLFGVDGNNTEQGSGTNNKKRKRKNSGSNSSNSNISNDSKGGENGTTSYISKMLAVGHIWKKAAECRMQGYRSPSERAVEKTAGRGSISSSLIKVFSSSEQYLYLRNLHEESKRVRVSCHLVFISNTLELKVQTDEAMSRRFQTFILKTLFSDEHGKRVTDMLDTYGMICHIDLQLERLTNTARANREMLGRSITYLKKVRSELVTSVFQSANIHGNGNVKIADIKAKNRESNNQVANAILSAFRINPSFPCLSVINNALITAGNSFLTSYSMVALGKYFGVSSSSSSSSPTNKTTPSASSTPSPSPSQQTTSIAKTSVDTLVDKKRNQKSQPPPPTSDPQPSTSSSTPDPTTPPTSKEASAAAAAAPAHGASISTVTVGGMLHIAPKSLVSNTSSIASLVTNKNDLLNNTFDALLLLSLPLIPQQFEIANVQKNTMSLTVGIRNDKQEMSSEWLVPLYIPNCSTNGKDPAFVNASTFLVNYLRICHHTNDIRESQYVCNNIHILCELFFKQNLKYDATIVDIIDNIKNEGGLMLMLKFIVLAYKNMLETAGVKDAFLCAAASSSSSSSSSNIHKQKRRKITKIEADPITKTLPALILNYRFKLLDTFTKFPLRTNIMKAMHVTFTSILVSSVGYRLNREYLCPCCRVYQL